MKITITKSEAKEIVERTVKSFFPHHEVKSDYDSYGDFSFTVTVPEDAEPSDEGEK